MNDSIQFQVTRVVATVPEGLTIEWQGRTINSGPLVMELDESAPPSRGVLDYDNRRAEAEFHLRLRFPEFAGMLESIGAPAEMTRPVSAVLRSSGRILDDHGFYLSGRTEIAPHGLFPPEETAASVLPGT